MKIATSKQHVGIVGLILFSVTMVALDRDQRYAGVSGYDVQELGKEKTIGSSAGVLDITNRERSEQVTMPSIMNGAVPVTGLEPLGGFAGISGYDVQALGAERTIGMSPDSGILDITNRVRSQELSLETEKKIQVKISGFIKHDCFIDQRKVYGYNHNHTFVYPLETVLDARGNDINNTPDWNMVPVQTRINLEIGGPNVGKAKTAGLIAVDFADPLTDAPGLLRLRRAFMTFEWEKDKLLLGHEYHPTSLDEIYPDTVGYSQGELFDPFAYATQVTVRHRVKKALFTVSTGADYKNPASINTGFFNDLFVAGHVEIGQHLLGAGVDVRAEVPRIVTNPLVTNSPMPIAPVATMAGINSTLAYVFGVIKSDDFKINMRFTFAENGGRYSMLGGIAVTDHNPVTDERKYTNTRAYAFWSELVYRRRRIEVGAFIGYTKNLGSFQKIIPTFTNSDDVTFSLIESVYNPELAYLVKFQPRIRYYYEPVVIGFELEYGVAGFGKVNDYAVPQNVKTVANPRFAVAVLYNF